MCREPFDVPTYRCRLIIERVATGPTDRRLVDFDTQNVMSIIEGFGLDFRSLIPTSQFTDIHFDIDPTEVLEDVLRELGLPIPN
jgi:hypothetical protein